MKFNKNFESPKLYKRNRTNTHPQQPIPSRGFMKPQKSSFPFQNP